MADIKADLLDLSIEQVVAVAQAAVDFEGATVSGTSTDAHNARERLFDLLRELGIDDATRLKRAFDATRG